MYLNPQCCVCFSGYGEGQFEKGRTTVFCFHHFHSLFFQKLISSSCSHTPLRPVGLLPLSLYIWHRDESASRKTAQPLAVLFLIWLQASFQLQAGHAQHQLTHAPWNKSLPSKPTLFSHLSSKRDIQGTYTLMKVCSCFFSFSQGAEVINSGSYWRHLGLIGGFKINNPLFTRAT